MNIEPIYNTTHKNTFHNKLNIEVNILLRNMHILELILTLFNAFSYLYMIHLIKSKLKTVFIPYTLSSAIDAECLR